MTFFGVEATYEGWSVIQTWDDAPLIHIVASYQTEKEAEAKAAELNAACKAEG